MSIGIGVSIALAAGRIIQAIANLFVDEAGDHLTDENGDRLGESQWQM